VCELLVVSKEELTVDSYLMSKILLLLVLVLVLVAAGNAVRVLWYQIESYAKPHGIRITILFGCLRH
jgi:hypothetical protein